MFMMISIVNMWNLLTTYTHTHRNNFNKAKVFKIWCAYDIFWLTYFRIFLCYFISKYYNNNLTHVHIVFVNLLSFSYWTLLCYLVITNYLVIMNINTYFRFLLIPIFTWLLILYLLLLFNEKKCTDIEIETCDRSFLCFP